MGSLGKEVGGLYAGEAVGSGFAQQLQVSRQGGGVAANVDDAIGLDLQ